MPERLLHFSTVGSVDDGKSTLIGRLLHDTGSILDDQLAATRKASKDGLEFAFFTDGLRSEREQGITIDVAYRYFSTPNRRFILADTPGHEQYTANMVTGSATADAAVILVDVCHGVVAQTRRHAYLAWLLGIRKFCVIINKMDKVDFRLSEFESVRRSFCDFAHKLQACDVEFIPTSALLGDNVAHPSHNTPWYDGPTLLEFLEAVGIDDSPKDPPLRFPIQYVIRGRETERLYAGQLTAGLMKRGDRVLILPARREATIRSIVNGDMELGQASGRMSVAVTFSDPVDAGRGSMVADLSRPPTAANVLQAIVFWMGRGTLAIGESYVLKHTTQEVVCEVTGVVSALNIDSLEHEPSLCLAGNAIGRIRIESHAPIFCDTYTYNRVTGSFVLIDRVSHQTVAAGLIEQAECKQLAAKLPQLDSGMTVWFTGLPSSGKTTLSQKVANMLQASGRRVEVLDGDSLRRHLGNNLGFSRSDREENIRRIAFVARLLARHNVIVLVSAIAPYRTLRDEVRRHAGAFVEIYVNAPLSVCEQRDVKGLYRRAREGELKHLTGIDDPYEAPLRPEIECHTDRETVQESAEKVFRYLLGAVPAREYRSGE